MQKAETGSPPQLVLHCSWSLRKKSLGKAREKVSQMSESIRKCLKALIHQSDPNDEELEKLTSHLKERGFVSFSGSSVVWEELGYTKDDWNELVDTLEMPEKIATALKLAAKAKRGSNKTQWCVSVKNGLRTMYYMKVQVMCDENGFLDALIALYRFDAAENVEEGRPWTDIETERRFKRFVELDAQREWKSEVKQFMHDTEVQEPLPLKP